MSLNLDQALQTFIAEARALLHDLEEALLRLETDPSDADTLGGMDPTSFLRYLGTLGQIVSITTLADALPAAPEMDAETCYLGFEIDFKSEADKETIAGVFEFVREGSLIHILPPFSKISEYIALIRSLPENETRLGEILVTTGALTQQELADGLSAQQSSVKPDGSTTRLGEILVRQNAVEPVIVQEALEKQAQTRDNKAKENRYVRVHADKLDELISLVGELVIAGAGANLLALRTKDGALQEATSVMSGLVQEIRDGALRLRMVPIGETFNRFQRVVRDVGRELGKDIELVITGADTELDKTVVEKIGAPLMHLVRNALDHGIESAAQRRGGAKTSSW